MKEILRKAKAGTFESSDTYVEIDAGNNDIEIELESVVELQFGEQIKASAMEELNKNQIQNAKLSIKDHGALDCVIRARIETAIERALKHD